MDANPPTIPISVAQLGKRFGKGNRWAAAVMRRMRHVHSGRDLFTTEEWLAEFLAAQSVPQQNWPQRSTVYDPLEEVVSSRVIQLVGELARAGKIRVQGI